MKISGFTYFYPERPYLIHESQPLFKEFSRDPKWVAERKYNGTRLQLHFIGGGPHFWGRHAEPLKYEPSKVILSALGDLGLKGYCLLDGELRHHKVKGIAHRIIFYDVFIWQGELLIGKPFWYRRSLLANILKVNGEPLGIPEQFQDDFPAVFRRVTQDPEIEGLVMKNVNGKLALGRNAASDSIWMYKVRRPSESYRF